MTTNKEIPATKEAIIEIGKMAMREALQEQRQALISEIEERIEKLPVGYDRDFNDTGVDKQEVLSILTNLREEE